MKYPHRLCHKLRAGHGHTGGIIVLLLCILLAVVGVWLIRTVGDTCGYMLHELAHYLTG